MEKNNGVYKSNGGARRVPGDRCMASLHITAICNKNTGVPRSYWYHNMVMDRYFLLNPDNTLHDYKEGEFPIPSYTLQEIVTMGYFNLRGLRIAREYDYWKLYADKKSCYYITKVMGDIRLREKHDEEIRKMVKKNKSR